MSTVKGYSDIEKRLYAGHLTKTLHFFRLQKDKFFGDRLLKSIQHRCVTHLYCNARFSYFLKKAALQLLKFSKEEE
jgi:hypothetical protein